MTGLWHAPAAFRRGRLTIVVGLLIVGSAPARTQVRPDTAGLLASLRAARIVELNFVWDAQSPLLPLNPPFSLALAATHASTAGMIPGLAFAGDMMFFSGQHGAPTIDAIGHISSNGKLHGGLDAAASEGPQGLKALGIETYPRERLVNRGVLLDVARFKKVDALAAGQEVTGDDLEATARAQRVDIRAGDSVLVRTGYGRFFTADKAKYLGIRPGIGESGARWLAAKKTFLTGADTLTYDVFPEQGTTFPAHRILIAESGIYIVENFNLEELGEVLAASGATEFALVVNPLRFRGATASPLNAFAILAP
jgi:kynurenine formamidase